MSASFGKDKITGMKDM